MSPAIDDSVSSERAWQIKLEHARHYFVEVQRKKTR